MQAEFPHRTNDGHVRSVCAECTGGKKCCSCNFVQNRAKFTQEEWNKNESSRKCKACMTKVCRNCKSDKTKPLYTDDQWNKPSGSGLCYVCNKKRCHKCKKEKGKHDFTDSAWDLPRGSKNMVCNSCNSGASAGWFLDLPKQTLQTTKTC